MLTTLYLWLLRFLPSRKAKPCARCNRIATGKLGLWWYCEEHLQQAWEDTLW